MTATLADARNLTVLERRKAVRDLAACTILDRLRADDEAALAKLVAERQKRLNAGTASREEFIREFTAAGMNQTSAAKLADAVVARQPMLRAKT